MEKIIKINSLGEKEIVSSEKIDGEFLEKNICRFNEIEYGKVTESLYDAGIRILQIKESKKKDLPVTFIVLNRNGKPINFECGSILFLAIKKDGFKGLTTKQFKMVHDSIKKVEVWDSSKRGIPVKRSLYALCV